MAVHCAGCGRAYDEARFDLGRTLWCTCGRRVGVPLEAPPLRPGERARFVADAMLARLARWLRLLGFDCSWDADASDEELVRRALAERRIVLTRDRALPEAWWVSCIHLIEAGDWPGELREVIERFDLAGQVSLFSRCADCNLPLEPLAADEAERLVPPEVREMQTEFTRCPGCGRVFWPGTHTDRIRAFVAGLRRED